MGTQAVVVHAGPIWEVQLLQGLLEEEGIQSFIPDENTKRVDPLITGGNAFATSLVVAKADAQRAQALIERHKEVAEARDPDIPPHRPPTEMDRLTQLGTRVRWSSILMVTAPLALWWGFQYVMGLKQDTPRPPHHALTVAAIFLALILVCGWILIVFDPFGWHRGY